jgi:integrase
MRVLTPNEGSQGPTQSRATTVRKVNFTKAEIERVPPAPAGKRDYYNDTKVRGLQLMVTDTGAKSYYLYMRNAGRPHRHRLGAHPALTPELARMKATVARGRAAGGVDLRAERKAEERSRVTLVDAFEAYKQARSGLRPTTLYYYGRYIEVGFATWKDRPLVKLTKESIAKEHKRLTDERGPAYADGAMRSLRAVINFAQFHYEAPDGSPLLPENPVRRLSQTRAWNRVKRRTTYVKPPQLAPWFAAVLALKADPEKHEACTVADWLLLLMLTGLRRSEGLQLRWADVDLAHKTLTVRDPKNHINHTLPLTDYLHELLKARRDAKPEDSYVFSSYGEHGYLVDPRKPLEQVAAESGVKFTPHDLRRTFITVAESIDVPAYALKRLLNHKMRNDVTAGYIITDVERLRKPMQDVTNFILRSAGLKAPLSTDDASKEQAK